jgi:hypothetical protein
MNICPYYGMLSTMSIAHAWQVTPLRFRALALLLLCLPMFSLHSYAQDNVTPLALDVAESGQIDATTPSITYAFASEAGGIRIDINAPDGLVPVYQLTDSLGSLITENPNLNREASLQEDIALTKTDLYLLTIQGASNTTGTFTLTVGTNAIAPTLTCQQISEQSMEVIDLICRDTGRNEVCYGNLEIDVDTRNNTPVDFDAQGDIVPLALVDSLTLSPLNEATGEWGVALMQVQADLPDTVPGQNVAVLIFGDVQVRDAVATGSNMQSFYFTPGVGRSQCGEAPADGILIRTPEGVAQVSMRVNEVDITLGSTAFLSVTPNETLDVVMLEGFAQVTARDGVQLVRDGQKVSVPVNEEGLPVDVPQFPEPVDLETYQTLPTTGLIESAPQPSQPIVTLEPPLPTTPIIPTTTPDPSLQRPELPATGNCVLRTFEATEVNVRDNPNLDSNVVTFILPTRLYSVTAMSADGDWYRLADPFGWVAGFVTERGGNCGNLMVIAPTATPTPLPLATSTPLPDFEIDPLYVDVDYDGGIVTYSGTINTRTMDDEDTLIYTFINVPMPPFMKQFDVSITCSGTGMVSYDYDGSIGTCSTTSANFTQLGDFEMNNSGSITIYASGEGGVMATWTITLRFN